MLEYLGKDVCQCQKVNYTSSAKSRKGSWNRENVLAAMSMMTWDIQQLVAWCLHTPLLRVVLAISQPCPCLPGSKRTLSSELDVMVSKV